ncbi:na+ h+ exchanger 1 [Moniliophthora roreri]|uniref:Cation/H+ exchanger transmembrane domain-containing protein n=1 Tax=Moniliophthora roreri TaxID=221103 RepID=A0A0W0ETB0_MONRR|nr:na+ h+ exchanger 1 [Moniliophthora roreri]
MKFQPYEVTIPHIIYACLGGFVVLFGMFSLFLREKLYIGEACWAFLFGVIIGPYGANIFNPRGWGHGEEEVVNTVTLEFTRVVLAIGVFAIGVELPKAYMRRHWKSLFFLLGPVMTWGWFVSAAFIYALVPGLNFLSALAVAACLTPTDPILAQAVVGGKYADKHVPAHLRHLLAAESGCNDGAAFPFLFIALYLILDRDPGIAIRNWFVLLWVWQVVLGIIIGAVLGFGFRHLMKFCERKDLIDRHSYVAQYVSLAIFTIGVTCLLGSDDLLSTFACGAAFAWDGFFNRQTEESVFSSVMDLLFNIAAFVYVGAWMPFSSFADASLTLSVWRLVVIAILVLLFRRLPVMIALYKWIPDVKTFREAVFSGHFGPIGIGAVFISTLAAEFLHEEIADANDQTRLLAASIQPITAFMVLCSILIHGLSIPSFSLGRRVHSVSRTWSRHTTIGGSNTPEWATQATHVARGEDIVINRDPERQGRDVVDGMERGELTPGTEKSPTSSTDMDEKEATTKRTSGSPHGHAEILPEGETPPDGAEMLSEWQEGPHRVIERRKGPGEEVEVEVIRNYGSPEARSSLFHGNREAAHSHIRAYLTKLRHLVEAEEHEASAKAKKMENVAANKTKEVERDVQILEEKAKSTLKEAVSPDSSSTPPHSRHGDDDGGGGGVPQVVVDDSAITDDDEEGWASDDDDDDDPSTGAEMVAHRRGSDSASRSTPKVKLSGSGGRKPKIVGSGRRRNSMRKGLLGTISGGGGGGGSSSGVRRVADEDRRGRSPAPIHVRQVSNSSTNDTVSARNLRVDTIRALHSQREASPARSVRFMEDEISPGRSGTASPRYSSVFHHGAPSSAPGTPPPERADESEGTKS